MAYKKKKSNKTFWSGLNQTGGQPLHYNKNMIMFHVKYNACLQVSVYKVNMKIKQVRRSSVGRLYTYATARFSNEHPIRINVPLKKKLRPFQQLNHLPRPNGLSWKSPFPRIPAPVPVIWIIYMGLNSSRRDLSNDTPNTFIVLIVTKLKVWGVIQLSKLFSLSTVVRFLNICFLHNIAIWVVGIRIVKS